MAGHSKWSQIKRKKAVTDSRRGKLWTKLLKEITVAAKLGGGDPSGNPRLRVGIQEARSANVPKDNIDKAIKRGTGQLEGVNYEELTYEGYAPHGVAVLVETMTDNKNRTVSELRHLFSKNGGNLGENGCVAWMFDKRGYFGLSKETMDEDAFMELALEIGADDANSDEDAYEIFSSPESYAEVREALEARGVAIATQALAMMPQNTMDLGPDEALQVLRLVEAIEDQDDVQNVWSNLNVTAEVLAAVESS